MMSVNNEILKEKLSRLGLFKMEAILDGISEDASKQSLTYAEFLDLLVEEELQDKADKLYRTMLRFARFPYVKTLEDFDFSFQPSIDERKIKELCSLSFIGNGENIIFLGPPGVGKTHLAVGIGLKVAARGMRVHFTTLLDMIASLMKAYADSKLEERMRFLTSPKLLIIDEVGYLPLDKHGSNLFFQLICRRYEKGSIIITSNKSYSDWGEIFASDSVIASAILDRLLHHSTTINIKGDSYRLKEKLKAGLVNTKGGLAMAES